jgi:hypothetical protein
LCTPSGLPSSIMLLQNTDCLYHCLFCLCKRPRHLRCIRQSVWSLRHKLAWCGSAQESVHYTYKSNSNVRQCTCVCHTLHQFVTHFVRI